MVTISSSTEESEDDEGCEAISTQDSVEFVWLALHSVQEERRNKRTVVSGLVRGCRRGRHQAPLPALRPSIHGVG